MLPFEFVVEGPPVSQQGRRKQRLRAWREAVESAAKQFWPAGDAPIDGNVSFTITHFYEGAPADVDNIVKPILDSIKELVYLDDSQVTDLICRRRPLQGPYVADPVSPVLAVGIDLGREFLHIRVAAPPGGGELVTV